jgi:hypothetical protein
MWKKSRIAVLFASILLISVVGAAFAQESDPLPVPDPCAGEQVSGTVVAVDEAAGVVTVDTGNGLCTVALGGGTFAHPIVALLGTYFDDVSAETLAAALADVSRFAVQDESGDWQWVEEGAEGAVPVRVVAVVDNGDGTFTVELAVEGQEDPVFLTTGDAQLASDLQGALKDLVVLWSLNEDGTLTEAGDRIAAYHEDGLGFGVLTKLFAMAQESQEACAGMELAEGEVCGVTVEELVAAFQSGAGIGQLFKEHGKPSMVGVGHVRKDLKTQYGETGEPQGEALGDLDQDRDRDRDQDQDGKSDAPGQKKDKQKDKSKEKDKDKDKSQGGPPAHANPPGHDKKK